MSSKSANSVAALAGVLFALLAGSNVATAQAPEAMVIDPQGNVGIGTATPTGALDIFRADGTAVLRLQETQAIPTNIMFSMMHNGNPGFTLENTASNAQWEFRLGGSGGSEQLTINKFGTGAPEFAVLANGNAYVRGTVVTGSSRELKQDILPLDATDVLDKLSRLNLYEWSYTEAPHSRHVGPMAEDYDAIFGLAGAGRGIAPTDLASIALASSKALVDRLNALEEQNASLREQLADTVDARSAKVERLERENTVLAERLAALEALVRANLDDSDELVSN